MKPIVYEYRTGIEVARVHRGLDKGKLELLFSREASIEWLRVVSIPSKRKEMFGDEEGGPRVEVFEGGSEHSLILKSSAAPEKSHRVERLHKEIVSALESEHMSDFKRAIEIQTKPFRLRKEMLRKWIATLQDQLDNFLSKSNDQNGVTSLIYSFQIDDIREKIAEVHANMTDAESAIEVIKEASHPTRISFLASQSEDPVGTGKTLIAALSLVLGLMLGVFAAFFAEFLAKARDARQGEELVGRK